MPDFSKFIEWLKLSPKIYFVLSLIAGILLFGSDSLLTNLGLLTFTSKYRQWIGLAFLLTSALVLISAFSFVIEKSKIYWYVQTWKQQVPNLTIEEKRLLSSYIENKTKTRTFPIIDGTVNGLVQAHFIYRSSKISGSILFPYNIQPWAWKYFNKHPELLNLEEE